ncbi:MAG: hypothetical protein R2864_00305 [Syntrophotaleaceae bacterium]
MSLRKALVESVRTKCSGLLQTKVEGFLRPPVLESKVSSFTVATLENGAIGISYNLFHGDEDAMARYRQWPLKKLCGKHAGEVMEWVLSDDLLEEPLDLPHSTPCPSTLSVAILNIIASIPATIFSI